MRAVARIQGNTALPPHAQNLLQSGLRRNNYGFIDPTL